MGMARGDLEGGEVRGALSTGEEENGKEIK